MMDMEERVRHELHDLADTVPPSIHPRAELDRRLTGGRGQRWRAPAVAAAAAAVVAAVAIPLTIGNGGESGVGVGTTAPTVASASDGPGSGYHDRFVLASFGDHEAMLDVMDHGWCLSSNFDADSATGCTDLGPWPQADPVSGTTFWVQTQEVVGDDTPNSGSLPKMLLFTTAPTVTTLEVTGGLGEQVSVRVVAENAGARYWLAEFPASFQGFGYTAKDADGNIVVSAIT